MPWNLLPLLVIGALPPVEDITTFGPRAQDGLAHLPGCFSLSGTVTQHEDAGIFGEEDQQYTFTSQLREGVWSSIVVTSRAPETPRMSIQFKAGELTLPFVPPLLGHIDGMLDNDDSLIAALLTLFSTPVETEAVTTTTEGDHEVYRYERFMDARRGLFGGTRANHAEVLFDPATLRPHDWHLVTEIPEKTGDGFRVHHLDAHLRLDPTGAPVADDLDAQGSLGPFRLRIVRTIRFTNLGACPPG